MIFNSYSLDIVTWCAEECFRQKSGEISVPCMVRAFEKAHIEAHHLGRQISYGFILTLGKEIEPILNRNGFRSTPVVIGDVVIPALDWSRQIELYVKSWRLLSSLERYKEFERMHPFIDGNGRVGAILYNWDRIATEHRPLVPPDVF